MNNVINNDVYEEISPKDVQFLINDPKTQIIDVRDVEEFEKAHIPGSQSIPINEISTRMSEINKDRQIITVSLSGERSQEAATLLSVKGNRVKSMKGGIDQWRGEISKGSF